MIDFEHRGGSAALAAGLPLSLQHWQLRALGEEKIDGFRVRARLH